MTLRGKAAIVSYGETPVTRARKDKGEPRLSYWEYFAWATSLALKKAGMTTKDLDGQGLAVMHPEVDHSLFLGVEVAEMLGVTSKWIITPSHGGASGCVGLAQAALAVSSGIVDRVLCVIGDAPMTYGDTMMLTEHRRDFEKPFGVMGPTSLFALVMRRHMEQYGTKVEHTGKIAVTQREHAVLNPDAVFKERFTMEDYLNSRMIAEPIRLLDTVMRVNGGSAFIVTKTEEAKRWTDKPVYLLGYGECNNYHHGSKALSDATLMGIGQASREALSMAGLEPRDMNFFQPYDDFTIAVLMQIEAAGFCEVGKGGKFIEETDLSYRGSIPLNTGGGQISAGQPGLAGGNLNLVEGVRQLRGEGEGRQIQGAKAGMVTGIGAVQYGRNVGYNSVAVLGSEL
ncbi:MAG: thiolase family protein [Thaumarchaeota archaeon]|nr:thiolase family protein [Nitrososphaerota archaeon]